MRYLVLALQSCHILRETKPALSPPALPGRKHFVELRDRFAKPEREISEREFGQPLLRSPHDLLHAPPRADVRGRAAGEISFLSRRVHFFGAAFGRAYAYKQITCRKPRPGRNSQYHSFLAPWRKSGLPNRWRAAKKCDPGSSGTHGHDRRSRQATGRHAPCPRALPGRSGCHCRNRARLLVRK